MKNLDVMIKAYTKIMFPKGDPAPEGAAVSTVKVTIKTAEVP